MQHLQWRYPPLDSLRQRSLLFRKIHSHSNQKKKARPVLRPSQQPWRSINPLSLQNQSHSRLKLIQILLSLNLKLLLPNLSKTLASSSQISHTTITLQKISNLSLFHKAILQIRIRSQLTKEETKAVGTRIGRTINISRNMEISTIKTKTVNIKATTSNSLILAEVKCTSKSITTTRIINMEITITKGSTIKARNTGRIAIKVRTRVTDPILITNRTTNRTSIGL